MKDKYTFFWRQESPFSQWYPCNFEIGGITYNSAEQYMMHQKALLFNDLESAGKIRGSSNHKEQKALGKKVSKFDEEVWNLRRESIVYQGNYEKFTQNPELYKILIETRGTTLVEASPTDIVWGIGLSAEDPRASDETKWRGQNLLGKILTKVREDIKCISLEA